MRATATKIRIDAPPSFRLRSFYSSREQLLITSNSENAQDNVMNRWNGDITAVRLRRGVTAWRDVGARVWGELADYEFLEEIGGGGFADADQRVFDG